MAQEGAGLGGAGSGHDRRRDDEQARIDGAGDERAADPFRHWTRRLYHLAHGCAPSHRPPVVTLRNASSRPYDGAIAAARTCYSPRVIGPDEVTPASAIPSAP